MEKLREFKSYMGLKLYNFRKTVSETRKDAAIEGRQIFKDFASKFNF